MQRGDTFDLSYFVSSRSELIELIRLGKVHAGIYIPSGFQYEFAAGRARLKFTPMSRTTMLLLQC